VDPDLRPVQTLHGVMREWVDERALYAASGEPPDHPLTVRELDREVWVVPPDRARELNRNEVAGWHAGAWWRRFHDGRFEQGHRDTGSELQVAARARAWLDPGAALSLLDWTRHDTGAVAGRPALTLRGMRRAGTDPLDGRLWWLGWYADEWLVQVDAERAVVLATEARQGGRPNIRAGFLSVAYDEALPPSLFEAP
jgi:hypothetical protein